ncbi:hypothetical protein [Actinoplanes sp. NPDC051851]|uniref:hypothetical protein n=1 Tax=Actinoplanes sp. NPDC051851 TaxID=3154753 RepID=UPI0034234E92
MSERVPLYRTLTVLGVALVAGAGLLFGKPAQSESTQPTPLAVAWPEAERGSLPAKLTDGSEYTPGLFLDAKTSAGTARTDGTLRLVIRRSGGDVRVLRTVPEAGHAPFAALTSSGDTLVWVESVKGKAQLWTASLTDEAPARMVTADVGDVRFYDSTDDLVIDGGSVHWVAAGSGQSTEFRSIKLTGGKVSSTTAKGDWRMTTWPWAVDGQIAASGTTSLRNLTTGQDIAVPTGKRTVTACSSAWCQLVSINQDGYAKMELSQPDGSARRKVAEGDVTTGITDVAVLDRFEIIAQVGTQAELSGNAELLIYDLSDRKTVLVSQDAGNITYRGGVLWWSTGDQSSYIRNSLDLRTVN